MTVDVVPSGWDPVQAHLFRRMSQGRFTSCNYAAAKTHEMRFASLALAAVASLSLVAGRRRYPRAGRFGFGTAVLATALLAAMVMPACGGGGGGGGSGANPGTPAGSYSLTVTGSVASGSSTLTRSVMLSLKVN